MDIEQQAAVIRAARAYLGLQQDDLAALAGVGARTLLAAEKGRACSGKTWAALLDALAARGVHWREGDGVEPDRILILPPSGA